MPYMVDHDGVVLGPYSVEDLQTKIRRYELALTDRACDQNGGLWLPISKLLAGKKAAASVITTEKADTSSILAQIKPRPGWFVVIGGFVLAMLLLLWRAFTMMHLVANMHQPR